MNKKQRTFQARTEAIEELRNLIKPGDTIYTILRSCSRSGMSRSISLVIKDNQNNLVRSITHSAAVAMDEKCVEVNGHNAIKIGGCGMDMGFALVYNLGRTLFPDGFTPKEAGKNYGRNGTSPDAVDTDGGYALNQTWL